MQKMILNRMAMLAIQGFNQRFIDQDNGIFFADDIRNQEDLDFYNATIQTDIFSDRLGVSVAIPMKNPTEGTAGLGNSIDYSLHTVFQGKDLSDLTEEEVQEAAIYLFNKTQELFNAVFIIN